MSEILWCKMCVCVYGLEATNLCLASKLMKKKYIHTQTHTFNLKQKEKENREEKGRQTDLYFGILGFLRRTLTPDSNVR